jgi:protein TonB
MEIKKSPKADLENKKAVFVQIGLVVSLSLVLIAFEWSSTDDTLKDLNIVEEAAVEEEIIPITRQEEVKPPPPPPPPKVSDFLNIVDDNVELDDELQLLDTEANQNTEVVVQYQDVKVEEEEEADAPVFFIVENMPVFPGGDDELRKFIAQSVKYPAIAQENGIQGRVFVSFVVNTKGEVTDVKVARGVDPNLDKEAVRVVQSMPKWKPGMQRGKAVKVSYTVPINFVLQ